MAKEMIFENLMKKMFLSVIMGLLLSGCTSPDVLLFDVASRRVTALPHGDGRQVILSVNEATSDFSTLSITKSSLTIITYDYWGKIKRTSEFPRLADHFGQIALADNALRIVYWKSKTRDLYVYDAANNTDRLVYKNAATIYGSGIHAVKWISDESIVLVLNSDNELRRDALRIEVINLRDMSRRMVYSSREIYGRCELSPDKRKLVFFDGDCDFSIVTVLDLESGAVLAASRRGQWCNLCWNTSGDSVAFSGEGNVWLLSLIRKEQVALHALPFDFTCNRIALVDGMLLYNGQFKKDNAKTNIPTPLFVVDLVTGMEKSFVVAPFNGKWIVIDGGKKLVCEIGF